MYAGKKDGGRKNYGGRKKDGAGQFINCSFAQASLTFTLAPFSLFCLFHLATPIKWDCGIGQLMTNSCIGECSGLGYF